MEDLRALASGICDDGKREKCEAEFGDNLDWACKNCKETRAEDIGEYTSKLLRLRTLRMAGYPFRANDFTPEEWQDLGEIERWLQTLTL